MSGTVSYPSHDFPSFPSVSITVPDGWQPIHSAPVLLAVGAAPEEGQFRPNVVVSVTRFPGGFTLQNATELIIDKFASLPGIAEIGRADAEVLGQPGLRYEASFSEEHVGALVQVVHLTVIDHGIVADLVQVTATSTGDQALTLLPQLRDIADSATRGQE